MKNLKMREENQISATEFLKIIRVHKSPLLLCIAILANIPILNIILLYLFFSFSFLFNDLVDIKKDRTRKDKILPKKSSRVLIILWVVSVVIIIATVLLSFMFISLKSAFIFGIAFILSMYYSYFLKPLFPSFAIQVWCFVAVFLSVYQSPYFSIPILIVCYILFYSRELCLDSKDSKSDSNYCITKPLVKVIE